MTDATTEDWANLPDPILVHVLSFLSVSQRCRAGTTCKHWLQCLETPLLWRTFRCGFFLPDHKRFLACVKQYGQYISHLTISLNQQERENRENAVAVINHLSSLDDIRLASLSVHFKGDNPLFYAGTEFLTSLSHFFTQLGRQKDNSRFKYLNLSQLSAAFDDNFVNIVSSNCPNLEYLNLLNKVLVFNVTAESLVTLAQRCCKLRHLNIYHTSLNNSVLEAFSQPNRARLQRLGIVCRREEKYGEDLTSEAWSNLLHHNPDVKVELGFDHTCPLHRVSQILKPEIPVQELHLATFTRIFPEVNIAASYYADSLEKLVIQTRPSKELGEALTYLAERCKLLHTLYVYCVLDKEVIEKVLALCPRMRDKKSYILKWQMDPEPWTVGQEEGD